VNNYSTKFAGPFNVNSFLNSNEIQFFFGQEYSDLACDPFYHPRYWESREKILTKIRDVIGLTNEPRSTVHNSQVMSRAVLKDFEDNFLVPNQLKYKDLMQIGP
jgi:hypothetical protein